MRTSEKEKAWKRAHNNNNDLYIPYVQMQYAGYIFRPFPLRLIHLTDYTHADKHTKMSDCVLDLND